MENSTCVSRFITSANVYQRLTVQRLLMRHARICNQRTAYNSWRILSIIVKRNKKVHNTIVYLRIEFHDAAYSVSNELFNVGG